jgi:hypothetical protein
MIKEKTIAKRVIDVMDDCSERINETIREVQQRCSDEEFRRYRKAAGVVMGYIYTDVVAPLYRQHPELEPEELRKGDTKGGG